jgi:hypothetical protein
VRLKETI